MPLIINSNGKAKQIHPLDRYFAQSPAKYVSQLYDELAAMSLDRATGDTLDRLAQVYDIERKDIK